jgi:hypothetical protein
LLYCYLGILLYLCVANDTVGQRTKSLSIVIVLQSNLAEMKFDQNMPIPTIHITISSLSLTRRSCRNEQVKQRIPNILLTQNLPPSRTGVVPFYTRRALCLAYMYLGRYFVLRGHGSPEVSRSCHACVKLVHLFKRNTLGILVSHNQLLSFLEVSSYTLVSG